MRKGYRIHKVRFAIFLLFLAMIFSFCTVNVLGANRDLAKTEIFYVEEQPAVQDYEVVCVKSGDSLWSIAKSFAEPTTDVRELVYEIYRTNRLTDGMIHPGDQILIPIS